MRTLTLYLLSLLLISCSDRERSNPLDPDNPYTHGAPVGLQILPHRRSALIQWSPFEVNNLEEYILWRSSSNSALIPYDTIAPPATAFLDTALTYDTPYRYAVMGKTTFSESLLSPRDSTVPGPLNVWIADTYGYTLRRISYDGRHVLFSRYIASPRALAVDRGNGIVWVADYYSERISGFRIPAVSTADDSAVTIQIPLSGLPVDIALDSTENLIWVAQLRDSTLRAYSTAGQLESSVALPERAGLGTRLAFDAVSASLWASVEGSGAIYRIFPENPVGSAVRVTSVNGPYQLAADPVLGGCWAATDSGLVYIDADNTTATFRSDMTLFDISVNPANGDCYYVGRFHGTAGWETGRIIRASMTAEALLGEDYGSLYGIQVIPSAAGCGFMVNQAWTWRLLRFSPDGQLMGVLPGFNGRLDFGLE